MATLKIGRASNTEAKPTQKAKQTWYADADGNPTTDATKAAVHLTDKGSEVLPHVAAKYGFVDGDIPTKSKTVAEAVEKVEEKSKVAEKSTAPTENKATRASTDQVRGDAKSK